MNSAPQTPKLSDWTMIALLGLVWGGSFLGVELALEGFQPITIAALRVGLAAIILTGFAYARGIGLPRFTKPVDRRIWMHCLGMGIFTNALPFSLLGWGQQHVTSAFAGISMALVPLFVLPLAHLLVPGEKMGPRRVIGLMLGVVGVVILIGPREILSDLTGDGIVLARIACVVASSCYAIGSIITRLSPKVDPIAFGAGALIISTLILIPTALIFEGTPQFDSATAIGGILYLGILPTAAATILLVRVIAGAGPVFLSLVNYQVPIWAVLLGAIILGEALPPSLLLAVVVILSGMVLAQYTALRALFTKQA